MRLQPNLTPTCADVDILRLQGRAPALYDEISSLARDLILIGHFGDDAKSKADWPAAVEPASAPVWSG